LQILKTEDIKRINLLISYLFSLVIYYLSDIKSDPIFFILIFEPKFAPKLKTDEFFDVRFSVKF
jgi:hypothetical protein